MYVNIMIHLWRVDLCLSTLTIWFICSFTIIIQFEVFFFFLIFISSQPVLKAIYVMIMFYCVNVYMSFYDSFGVGVMLTRAITHGL